MEEGADVPSITVVIPALDDAEMLARCLGDLAAQLRPADEIVVVDNGSTDETAAVARAGRRRASSSEPVRGIWPAASAGYDAATGDIIARLDADSRPPVDWLLHIEAEFVDSPEIGVLTGPGIFYDGNTLVAGLGQTLYIGGYFWSMEIWLGHPPIFGSNFAMRREVWQRVRGRGAPQRCARSTTTSTSPSTSTPTRSCATTSASPSASRPGRSRPGAASGDGSAGRTRRSGCTCRRSRRGVAARPAAAGRRSTPTSCRAPSPERPVASRRVDRPAQVTRQYVVR